MGHGSKALAGCLVAACIGLGTQPAHAKLIELTVTGYIVDSLDVYGNFFFLGPVGIRR